MIETRKFRNLTIMRMLLLIPVTLLIIIMVTSCAGSKKTVTTVTEVAPPPPPPPPPPPVVNKQPEVREMRTTGRPDIPYTISGADTVYMFCDVPPQFPGGKEAMNKFKQENLKPDQKLYDEGFSGNVLVSFIVGTDGKLSDFSISAGICPSFDSEALRVAKLMQPWKPGIFEGKTVKSRAALLLNFYPPLKDNEAPKEVFVVVEEMPVYPGGDTALMSFIGRNLKYPEEAKQKGIQGRVILRFCVNYKGGIEQVNILRGVDPVLDAEAVRVIKMLPEWQPGKQGGKPVNVWYSVPVTFALDGAPVTDNLKIPQGNRQITPQAPPRFYGYDEPPVYKGGERAMLDFIKANLKYPEAIKEMSKPVKVEVRLTINESGSPDYVGLVAPEIPAFDNEALRVVRLLTGWTPAKNKGVAVKATYVIPVIFR